MSKYKSFLWAYGEIRARISGAPPPPPRLVPFLPRLASFHQLRYHSCRLCKPWLGQRSFIAMGNEGLRTRLITLSESLRQDQQLIARLSKLPYQVGSAASDEQEAQVELSSGIHQSLKDHEEELDLLRQEFDDQFLSTIRSVVAKRHTSGVQDERTEVAAQLAGLAQDLKMYPSRLHSSFINVSDACDSTRIQFRKAQLTAKRNAEAAKRKEREILFADLRQGTDAPLGSHGRRKGQEKLTKDDILLSASNDVTAALRRAHRLMGQELERSQFARQTLGKSPDFLLYHMSD